MEGVTKVTMEDKGAPLIKKYKCFGPEGYGFIVIENDEAEASFKEQVTFNNFKGLQFLMPEKGQSYDILVPPGGNKTIVIKCDPEGYSMSSSASTQVIHGDSQLEQLCETTGKKAVRLDTETEEAYKIYQYCLKHGGGIAYLYVNETSDKTLEESIEFTMEGLQIEGKPDDKEVEIKIGPGERKLLKLVSMKAQYKI